MLCASCGKNQAAVFIQEIVNNQVREASLCAACAEAAGVAAGPEELFLPGLSTIPKEARGEGAPRCSGCGLFYSEFRKTGFLGCPTCYTSFKPALQRILARIHHGAVRHRGS